MKKAKNIKSEIKKIIKSKEKRSFIKSYLAKDIRLNKKFLLFSLGYNFSKVEAKLRKIDDRQYRFNY